MLLVVLSVPPPVLTVLWCTALQGKTVYISNPTWGNHRNIFTDEGVKWEYYRWGLYCAGAKCSTWHQLPLPAYALRG